MMIQGRPRESHTFAQSAVLESPDNGDDNKDGEQDPGG